MLPSTSASLPPSTSCGKKKRPAQERAADLGVQQPMLARPPPQQYMLPQRRSRSDAKWPGLLESNVMVNRISPVQSFECCLHVRDIFRGKTTRMASPFRGEESLSRMGRREAVPTLRRAAMAVFSSGVGTANVVAAAESALGPGLAAAVFAAAAAVLAMVTESICPGSDPLPDWAGCWAAPSAVWAAPPLVSAMLEVGALECLGGVLECLDGTLECLDGVWVVLGGVVEWCFLCFL